jgi:hypothetical protein
VELRSESEEMLGSVRKGRIGEALKEARGVFREQDRIRASNQRPFEIVK